MTNRLARLLAFVLPLLCTASLLAENPPLTNSHFQIVKSFPVSEATWAEKVGDLCLVAAARSVLVYRKTGAGEADYQEVNRLFPGLNGTIENCAIANGRLYVPASSQGLLASGYGSGTAVYRIGASPADLTFVQALPTFFYNSKYWVEGDRLFTNSEGVDEFRLVPKLSAVRNGESVSIEWEGAGQLQVAPAVQGPWDPIPRAVHPHLSSNSPAEFFRVKVQCSGVGLRLHLPRRRGVSLAVKCVTQRHMSAAMRRGRPPLPAKQHAQSESCQSCRRLPTFEVPKCPPAVLEAENGQLAFEPCKH